jgi:glutamate-1-semialdehyde 2,1-aminomutase
MVQAPVRSTIFSDYEERFVSSKALYTRALGIISGGIAHDGRYQKPFPIYVQRAE